MEIKEVINIWLTTLLIILLLTVEIFFILATIRGILLVLGIIV